MSLALLKQNCEILLEVAENYEKITKNIKAESENYNFNIKNFRNQFLYLLTGIHKMVEQEKNAK